MNELTMQEYYDIKVIQKFIDNYVDIMNPKNETLKVVYKIVILFK